MPADDAWDWPLMMYVATVLLKRTEKQFWRMTPRKLHALTRAHIMVNGSGDNPEQGSNNAVTGYIDQAF
jgi:uncharacterized phage protein (TIGR02216 family)